MHRLLFIFAILGCFASGAYAAPEAAFVRQRAPFYAIVNHVAHPFKITTVSAMPGDVISFEIRDADPQESYFFRSSETTRLAFENQKLSWTAPLTPGLYKTAIVDASSKDSMAINVFVLRSTSEVREGHLNGYRIGEYVPSDKPANRPPAGLIEVTRENEGTLVSPHFQLKQFVSKGHDVYPKYLALSSRLLIKLEMLLEEVNDRGFRANTFFVMSGYRTPAHNKALKNVPFGRHLWGEAADIYIDHTPSDGVIDDLNRDGLVSLEDAKVMYDLIDGLDRNDQRFKPFAGGLGLYRANAAHGPFVHTDVRGGLARW